MVQALQTNSHYGVMVCVNGSGVLISGSPGIGKSSLALQLIIEGHQLVADDVIDLSIEKNQLIGRSPSLLKSLLNTRELGTINIEHQFGSAHVSDYASLHYQLILHEKLTLDSQLEGNQGNQTILGINIPTLHLSISNPVPVLIRLLTWLNMQQSTNDANEQLKYRQQQQVQQ